MRHSNVSNDQGFTILEALIVVVFAGILAAIAGPSYFAWSQRRAVDSAITSIEGAIKEAQRQAMARSHYCNVAFATISTPAPNTPIVTSSPNPTPTPTTNPKTYNCLITGDRTLSDVTLAALPTSLNFDHLGNTTSEITVVVAPSANSSSNNFRKCLVLSQPLGLIRRGNYTGASGTTTSSSCVPE